MPGATAKVITEIDNSNCNLDVTKINAELNKYVNLKANSGHTKQIHKVVTKTEFPGLPAKTASVGE